jgi:hypothetical protein
MSTVLALVLFVTAATVVKIGVRRAFRGPAALRRERSTPGNRRRR